MRKEGIGLLRVDLLVILRLIHVERIRGTVPCVGLRGYFPRLESGRYPALQVGAVGILLEHIQKILRLRILVIALVHLSVAHTCVDGKRFGRFLRDKVDYRTGGTRAVQRTAGSFYNLDTVDGVQVETLVVEIPGHVARHALAVHQEQHVAGVEPLHGDFVSEAHLLDIQTGSFLLQCLLQVAVSGFDQLLAAQDLRRNGRHLDGSRCTRTGDDYLVQSQMIDHWTIRYR